MTVRSTGAASRRGSLCHVRASVSMPASSSAECTRTRPEISAFSVSAWNTTRPARALDGGIAFRVVLHEGGAVEHRATFRVPGLGPVGRHLESGARVLHHPVHEVGGHGVGQAPAGLLVEEGAVVVEAAGGERGGGQAAAAATASLPRALSAFCEACLDERGEERSCLRRPRGELGVELHAHAPGVVGPLHGLDQGLVGGEGAQHEPGVLERLAVAVGDLVAVPVAFADDPAAVGGGDAGVRHQRASRRGRGAWCRHSSSRRPAPRAG